MTATRVTATRAPRCSEELGRACSVPAPCSTPRQVSLTLSRVWEAAQGTRLPGHLSWLQTGTPKLSVTLTPGRDRSRRRQGARQAPAAGDPPCGSIVSSGRKCVSIRVMRTLGAVRKDELCHVLSWGSMTRVAGLSSTCAGDVWCVWAPCAQTRGPVASCPRGSLYASTRCPRAHVGTLHAPSEGKGPGVSQACSVDSEDSKTPSGNVPLLSRGKRVPPSVQGLSMPYSCPHPTLSPPSGCPQAVPCSPQEARCCPCEAVRSLCGPAGRVGGSGPLLRWPLAGGQPGPRCPQAAPHPPAGPFLPCLLHDA